MSVTRAQLVAALSATIPSPILTNLLNEYSHIKNQFFLRKYEPSELKGGRFGECVVRLIEYLNTGTYTNFGSHLTDTNAILNGVVGNTSLPDTVRFLIPKLTRVLLDVRNKRDVAHVGGDVSPNYSDSLLICHCADWILIEIVRSYFGGSIDTARKIVANINQIKIPLVTEVDGFVRVQNTSLEAPDKTLVVLYYKQPEKIIDSDIAKWIRYGNITRYKTILSKLDAEALIHYEKGKCCLLDKGVLHVERNIALELVV